MRPISAISVSRVRGADVVPLSPIGAETHEPRAREAEMADIADAASDGAIPVDVARLFARCCALGRCGDEDRLLLPEMCALDPEGTRQLLREMAGRPSWSR